MWYWQVQWIVNVTKLISCSVQSWHTIVKHGYHNARVCLDWRIWHIGLPYSHHISNTQVRAVTEHLRLSNTVKKLHLRFRCHIAHSTPNKAISCCWDSQAPSDWKQAPTRPYHHIHGSEPWDLIWDHWTSVFPTNWQRWQLPLNNTAIWSWTRLCSRECAIKRNIYHIYTHFCNEIYKKNIRTFG